MCSSDEMSIGQYPPLHPCPFENAISQIDLPSCPSIPLRIFIIVSTHACYKTNAKRGRHYGYRLRTTRLFILPEIGVLDIAVDATIALVSSLAGAASQAARIAELEAERNKLRQDLALAQSALVESETKLGNRISQLEDSLFEMDREFEGQTARMKKKYDNTLREELQALAVRLKDEFEVIKKRNG